MQIGSGHCIWTTGREMDVRAGEALEQRRRQRQESLPQPVQQLWQPGVDIGRGQGEPGAEVRCGPGRLRWRASLTSTAAFRMPPHTAGGRAPPHVIAADPRPRPHWGL